ncbi:hypothetical protein [Ancylobacter vacuolatus]|uniref:DUF2946 domain-containing protein n=1 Tax=Ancylobacter vacuolatus TaxID=223389 RepID=A0ABU0DIV8_9HYPH|nr:hypothetical protein [Ancylobacter vacuolatus]MDQ0348190.1 hypothetical protein [Ancylobacter vacuolatus]
MRLLSVFRLMLALVALGAVLAGPAAATRAMAAPGIGSSGIGSSGMGSSAMPCHEALRDQVPRALDAAPAGHPLVADAAASPLSPHLCCVLSALVMTPPAAPALRPPEAERAPLALPAGRPLAGLALPIPVPPPRLL